MRRGRKKQRDSFDPILSRGILAIVFVIFAIIIILSFLDKAGPLGYILNQGVLSFLFGSIRYATPAVLLIIAWFFIKDLYYAYRPTHGLGAILFFLGLAGMFHLGFAPDSMLDQAVLGHGGGVFGLMAWPLKTYLGNIAGALILTGMIAVSLLLMFNTLIIHLLVINKKIFARLGAFGRGAIRIINQISKTENTENEANEEEYEDKEDESLPGEDEDGGEDMAEDENENEDRAFRRRAKNSEPDEETEEADFEESEATPAAGEDKLNNSQILNKKIILRPLPSLNLLSSKKSKPTSGDINASTEIIKNTLREFGLEVDMGEARVGPTVTRYTLKPRKGVKLSRITALSNDLALALAAHPIRIEAPIPGQALVGIEVPNQKTAIITLKEILEAPEFKKREHNLMVALGKDVAGKVWFADLPKMPHLLIAGSTGSGKTVCVNTILMSLLYQNTAETLGLIMVDPKRVELTLYNGIPHLLTPVITNTAQTISALKWTINQMDQRFEILAADKSRDISSYNKKHPNKKIPHIVFVVDELADLMATAAGEVEAGIIRLAQMARAVGIHLVLATQRPSVDVITGLMKANIPGRIAFSLPSIIDSRTILDSSGAEKLIGRGDMLYLNSELSKPVRIQGAFLSEEDLKRVVEYLQGDEAPEYDETIINEVRDGGTISMFGGANDNQDSLFMEAKTAIVRAGKASASFLQRRLSIGYARAARILDQLEEAGIVGPADGAKPREILVTENEISDIMEIAMTEKLHGKTALDIFNEETGEEVAAAADNLEDEEEKPA